MEFYTHSEPWLQLWAHYGASEKCRKKGYFVANATEWVGQTVHSCIYCC